jgi:hypothetical protein
MPYTPSGSNRNRRRRRRRRRRRNTLIIVVFETLHSSDYEECDAVPSCRR